MDYLDTFIGLFKMICVSGIGVTVHVIIVVGMEVNHYLPEPINLTALRAASPGVSSQDMTAVIDPLV